MRGVLTWALAALLASLLLAGRASAQAGTVIVQLNTPPAAVNLPAAAKRTGAGAAAQRVARLGMASAAASSEQASFRSAATATGRQFELLHTYRYVSDLPRCGVEAVPCRSVNGSSVALLYAYVLCCEEPSAASL